MSCAVLGTASGSGQVEIEHDDGGMAFGIDAQPFGRRLRLEDLQPLAALEQSAAAGADDGMILDQKDRSRRERRLEFVVHLGTLSRGALSDPRHR
jgi:hypothetical protein